MASPFQNLNEVHIEITNMCNLSCDYCYAETLFPGKKTNLFTNELYRTTIEKLFGASKAKQIDVVFHGGEPLLHKAAWFEEACAFATEEAGRRGKTVAFSMQSNLTLLTDAHVSVFCKYGLRVGVSLDGDAEVHNKMRGAFDTTIKNLRILLQSDLFGGIIIVISHHNFDKLPEFFALLERLGVGTFHLNIASSVGRGAPVAHLGAEKTFQAFRDCVDGMLAREGRVIDTRMIRKISQFISPPKQTSEAFKQLRCDNMFCHAGVTMVAVQHDGGVFPCGCAGSSGNMKGFQLANVRDATEDRAHYFGKLEAFHAKKEKYYTECVRCPARFICEHGCPAFDHTDPITPEHTCLATKLLYEHLLSLDRDKLASLVAAHESGGSSLSTSVTSGDQLQNQ
jgi:uncharacterized protein